MANPVARTCAHCGKTFAARAYAVAQGNGLYCSRRCYGQHTRRRITRTCAHCGKSFEVRAFEVVVRGAGRYCSLDCYGQRKRRRVTRTCEYCGTAYETTPSHRVRFCSRPCFYAGRRGGTLADRLNGRLAKRRSCWRWLGPVDAFGYGVTTDAAGNTEAVHRLSYQLEVGPIPDGHEVWQTCGVRRCAYPAHLALRAVAEHHAAAEPLPPSHFPQGVLHPRAKLTEEQVRAIRRLATEGRSIAHLAAQFQVSPRTIRGIVTREKWAHLP